MIYRTWAIAVFFWLIWNGLIAAVALNLGVTWAFHSKTILGTERLRSIGGAWQSNTLYAGLIAVVSIAVFSYQKWKPLLSIRQIQHHGVKAFLQFQAITLSTLAVFMITKKISWVGVTSMTEKGALTPVLWLLTWAQITIFFFSVFSLSRVVFDQFLSEKVKPFARAALSSIIDSAVIWIWFDPQPMEIFSTFFVLLGCRTLFLAQFGFGTWIASLVAIFGLNIYGFDQSSLIRLEQTIVTETDNTLRPLDHWISILVALVWCLRMWYPEANEFIKYHIRRLRPHYPGRPGR